MIHSPCSGDIAGMKELWHICFGDDYDYINFFFDNRFENSEALVFEDGGKTVSQLFLLEGNLEYNGSFYKSYYLYAACTHPEYRNKGIMGSLLNAAKAFASERNVDFICLVPAEEHLFGYYSKFGYKTIFGKKRYCLYRDEYTDFNESCTADASNIVKLRNGNITSDAFFVWDENAFGYAVRENEFSDGKLICVNNGYALARPKDDKTVYIYEICCKDNFPETIITEVFSEFDCKKIILDTPSDFIIPGKDFITVNNGMACAVSGKAENIIHNLKNAYMGLPLE